MQSNFDTYPQIYLNEFYTHYDFYSIMHYPMYAFSRNGQPTLRPRVVGVTIGNRNDLSVTDITRIQHYYGCGRDHIFKFFTMSLDNRFYIVYSCTCHYHLHVNIAFVFHSGGSPHRTLNPDSDRIRDPETKTRSGSRSELRTVMCDSAPGQCVRSSSARSAMRVAHAK